MIIERLVRNKKNLFHECAWYQHLIKNRGQRKGLLYGASGRRGVSEIAKNKTSAIWSSPNDSVVRNIFGSKHAHAWTLLDVCLSSGNMSRAESVLYGLSEISSSNDVTLAVNKFLKRLIELNRVEPEMVVTWLKKTDEQILKFQENDATVALLFRNACRKGAYPGLLSDLLAKYDRSKIIHCLRQVEVLGADNIPKVMEAAGLTIDDLDSYTKNYLKSSENEKDINSGSETGETFQSNAEAPTESKTNEGRIAAPIKKEGYETLTPTESEGLVAIRHVLSGLQDRSNAEKAGISELLKLAELPHIQEKSMNDIDFFSMWKKLKTPEEKSKFSEILESINEKRQLKMEHRGVEAARMRWEHMFEQMCEVDQSGNAKVQMKSLETLLWEWNQAMMPLVDMEFKRLKLLLPYSSAGDVPKSIIKEHFAGMSKQAINDRILCAPYLTLAKPENLPAMTMMELVRMNKNQDNIRVARAMVDVGRNVEHEYKLEMRKRLLKNESEKSLSSNAKSLAHKNKKSSRTSSENTPKENLEEDSDSLLYSWPSSICLKIGGLLLSKLVETARVRVSGTDPISGKTVSSTSPAFHHTYQYQNGVVIGIIRPHKVVARYLSGERGAIQPQQLPMLCKPRNWTSWNLGGYWYTPSQIIRSKDSPEQIAYIAAASRRGSLKKVFDGLNVLGDVAWTVNKDIFKVVSRIWNSKEGFLDIPPHVLPVANLDDIPKPPRDSDPSELRDYRRKCRAVTMHNASLYSQRCDLNYKLDIARALLGERFYLPHNIDFRGRAYPLSPHFNHLANDVGRSLLMFWDGKRLGEDGFRWLKIHLANLFGFNKITHDERVKFVDDNIEKVIQCAKDPLNEKNSWWKEADSPFQALATCMEITNALEHPEGPENFESHLTVHQDGSCNGLQHYAALGGDIEGAREVNLCVSDKPQDVYSRVLEIVRKKVENETNENSKEIADLVLPVLSRKVVKQTVMTHVYGVTYIGARAQIANRLKEIDEFPQVMVYKASAYIARHILDAVRELFVSAHEIQDWLSDNASRISKAIVPNKDLKNSDQKFVSSVIWTNPLGLPIVQPYRREKTKVVVTELQSVTISDPYSFQAVNSRKQRTAFPPNYIHSLDATHMFLSALKCKEDGINFAAVHDSYWTHAADVSKLNKNLRECFVQLYSKNLIQNLKDEFQLRYGSHLEVVDIPKESEIGKKIKALHDEYSIKLHGKARRLSIAEQLELEMTRDKSDPNVVTPVDIMKELSADDLNSLVRDTSKKSSVSRKSGESVGPDYEEESERDDEELTSVSHNALRVLTPVRIPEIPKRGSFDVKNVLNSPYFFS